jgi:hypothetical protein
MQYRILYTANIRGKLDLLPRLHTFMRRLRAQPVEDEEAVMICAVEQLLPQNLLLDLGNSCAPETWHCAATEGRSTLIVLDAMGYDAANVEGLLTEAARQRLRENFIRMALVEGTPLEREGLHIHLKPAAATRLDGNALALAGVNAGQVGLARVGKLGGRWTLFEQEVLTVPPETPPDATIAGAVDFVLGEARLYQRRHEG